MAAFTGGSSLPFVIFEDKTCTAIMGSFDEYQFSLLEDNGSTSSARAFEIKGDVTAVTIDNVVG